MAVVTAHTPDADAAATPALAKKYLSAIIVVVTQRLGQDEVFVKDEQNNYKNSTRDCSPAPVRRSAGMIVRRPRSTKFPILYNSKS